MRAELHSKMIVAPIIHYPRCAVALELFRRLICKPAQTSTAIDV
jgi:hypothetical protein